MLGLLAARARASASPSATSDGCRRLFQDWASQYDHGIAGGCVGPLGQPAVGGWASVFVNVYELHGAEVRKGWPGRRPGVGRSCHGDDGAGALEVVVQVFGADPAHRTRVKAVPAATVDELASHMPGGMIRSELGIGDGAVPELEGVGSEVLGFLARGFWCSPGVRGPGGSPWLGCCGIPWS